MNWIKENKFLAGFIAVVVVGCGALGYLLYTAYGAYGDISDQYNQQAGELHRLQSLTPFPDQANLAKYQAERDDLIDATGTLATSLSQMVLPVVEMSPSAFQDHLRDTVSAIVSRAGQIGVKLPEKFSLDFEKYESQPPPAAAAGPLGRQLAALQVAMNILLDEHVDAVSSLQRTPLPQETGGGGTGGGRGGRGGGPLVEKNPFEIRFTANQPSFQKVLNDFAASTKQFFITRTLIIENTDPKPVSKSSDLNPPAGGGAPVAAGPAAVVAEPGAAAGTGTVEANRLHFIVGTEKLTVAMRIDIVSFNQPEKSGRKGGAGGGLH